MKIPPNSVPETNAFFREMETDMHCMAVKKLYLPHVQTLTFIGYNFG